MSSRPISSHFHDFSNTRSPSSVSLLFVSSYIYSCTSPSNLFSFLFASSSSNCTSPFHKYNRQDCLDVLASLVTSDGASSTLCFQISTLTCALQLSPLLSTQLRHLLWLCTLCLVSMYHVLHYHTALPTSPFAVS